MKHFHCAYQPQSSGLVGRTNGVIKTSLRQQVGKSVNLIHRFTGPYPIL